MRCTSCLTLVNKPGLRLRITHAQQAFIGLQHLNQADHALVIGGGSGHACPRQHGGQFLLASASQQCVLHVLRGAHKRLPMVALRSICPA